LFSGTMVQAASMGRRLDRASPLPFWLKVVASKFEKALCGPLTLYTVTVCCLR
jgi:hypothetical protein